MEPPSAAGDRGVNVHLDGEVDEDWAHMAQAKPWGGEVMRRHT